MNYIFIKKYEVRLGELDRMFYAQIKKQNR